MQTTIIPTGHDALLTRAAACCAFDDRSGADRNYEFLKEMYREFGLFSWDEARGRDTNRHTVFQRREGNVPWLILHDGVTYQQAQCSGSAMSYVMFEEVQLANLNDGGRHV